MEAPALGLIARKRRLRRVVGLADSLTLRLEALVPPGQEARVIVVEQRLSRRDADPGCVRPLGMNPLQWERWTDDERVPTRRLELGSPDGRQMPGAASPNRFDVGGRMRLGRAVSPIAARPPSVV